MFFPRDMFWGWAQLDLAPPHNEIDPNLCSGNAAANGGINDPCSLFARYMLSGILEVRPFGRGPLRRFMVYGAPTFLFGKTIPKTLYTWSPDAIGIEHSWGVGIYLNKGFEFRVTQHFLFDRLGARDKNLGPADLGNNGPWGRYVTLGVRKTFRHTTLVEACEPLSALVVALSPQPAGVARRSNRRTIQTIQTAKKPKNKQRHHEDQNDPAGATHGGDIAADRGCGIALNSAAEHGDVALTLSRSLPSRIPPPNAVASPSTCP